MEWNRAQPLTHPCLEIIQGRDEVTSQCDQGGLLNKWVLGTTFNPYRKYKMRVLF